MKSTRREALRSIGLVSAAGVAGVAGTVAWEHFNQHGGDSVGGVPRGHAAVTWAVETKEKLVALTFDDGPLPNYTPLVLDSLEAANVRATFFLVGDRLEKHAGLVEGRLDRHEVGNHTWSHRDLSAMDFNTAHAEVKQAHDVITKTLGREPRLLRPPFGHIGALAMRAADSFGYDVILWSHGVTEREFQTNPDRVIPYVVDNMTPGMIFLAHDVVADGVEPVFLRRLGDVVSGLRGRGYEFVTVSELLARREPGIGLADR
jgi:peptidoglycan/xylan/chitin deacetylase (PgdA/CDA1 family)